MSDALRPRLTRMAPYLPVTDVAGATSFYIERLGFVQEYAAGSPPEFAILSRDGHAIMLRLVPDPTAIVPNERQGGTWDIFFWVDDAGALCDAFRTAGATIAYGPVHQTAYGMLEFAVRDPNGYVLGFGQPMAPS